MTTYSTSHAVLLPFAPRKDSKSSRRQHPSPSALPSTTDLSSLAHYGSNRDSSFSMADQFVIDLPTRTRTLTPSMFSESSFESTSSSSSSASSSASYPPSSIMSSPLSSLAPSPSPRTQTHRKLRPLPVPPMSPPPHATVSPIAPEPQRPTRITRSHSHDDIHYVHSPITAAPATTEFPAPPSTPAPPYSPRQNIYRLPSPPPIPTFTKLCIPLTTQDDSSFYPDVKSRPLQIDLLTPIIESPVAVPAGQRTYSPLSSVPTISPASAISLSSFPLPPPPPFEEAGAYDSEPSSPHSSDSTPTPTGAPRVRPLPLLPVAPGPPSECTTPIAMFPRRASFSTETLGSALQDTSLAASDQRKLGDGGEDGWASESRLDTSDVDGEMIDWDLIGEVMETAA